MAEERFEIRGQVRNSENRTGIKGLLIEAYDADFFFDDKLGSAITDAEGSFKITYSRKDFQHLFDKKPDLYLVIRGADGKKIFSTRERVRINAGREETFFIDLSPEDFGRPRLQKEIIGGLKVNSEAFKEVSPDDLLALVRAYRGKGLEERRYKLFHRVSPELVRNLGAEEKTHQEANLTGNLNFVEVALHRLRAPSRFFDLMDEELDIDPGANIETHPTAHFLIRYTTDGDCADRVDPSDTPAEDLRIYGPINTVIGTTIAGSGTPNYIQKLGIWLEYAFDRYANPPYSLKDPRINGQLIDVTVEALNSFGKADPLIRNLRFDNDLNNNQLASSSVHELFHLVQYQYQTGNGELPRGFMFEGTNRAVEDTINDNLNRWMYETINSETYTGQTFMQEPNASLSDLSYIAGMFWKYMTEQHSVETATSNEPIIGIDLIRKAWELAEIKGAANINIALNLREDWNTPFYGTFSNFIYNLPGVTELSTNETTFGNWLAANYLKDLADPNPDRRFDYFEDEAVIEYNDVNKNWESIKPHSEDTLNANGALNYPSKELVAPWAGRYHVVKVGTGIDTVKVSFSPDAAFTAPLVQLLVIEKGDTLRDIIKFDKMFVKTLNAYNLDRIVVIVGAKETGGPYSLRAEAVDLVSDAMVTRWNSVAGQEHEIDPINWSWTWVSPDIWVDNEDGSGVNEAHFEWDNPKGGSNHLYIQLRNKGTKKAEKISVEFYYQDASAGLRDDNWKQVIESKNSPAAAILSDKSLDPGKEDKWFVNWWLPKPSGTEDQISRHFCIKAIVKSPADVNTDNKMVMSNFGIVDVELDTDLDNALYLKIWAEALPSTAGSIPKPRRLETFIIPRNEISLEFNKRDFASLYQIDLQNIDAEIVEPHVPARNGMTGLHEGAHLAGTRNLIEKQYRLRFSLPQGKGMGRKAGLSLPIGANEAEGHIASLRRLDPRTLPPGAAGLPMVTLVQAIGGMVTGGVTYAIRMKKAK
jgi:hypothetical protein